MTKEELLEKYKDYIKYVYFYPYDHFKVWFKNDKKVIFYNITHFEAYMDEHKGELL